MYYAIVLIAGIISFTSCNKHDEVVEKRQETEKNLTVLDKAHAKGLFLGYTEENLRPTSQVRALTSEDEALFAEFLSQPEVQSLVLKELDNPFASISKSEAYKRLPNSLREELRHFSSDSELLAVWKEGVQYILKHQSGGTEARQIVYSQLLSQGPQHAEGNKQVLKAVGIFAVGIWGGGGLRGGVAALAGYLIGLW